MAKINFKPNEDRVLVEPAAAEEKTASGIIIPEPCGAAGEQSTNL